VAGVPLADKNAARSGDNIAFVRTRAGKPFGQAEFAFTGSDERGKKRTILMANARSFRLLSVKKKLIGDNEVVVEVTEFPALTPMELLKLKPTYSVLAAGYQRKVKLTMPDLALAGADWPGDTIHIITPLRDLDPNVDVTLQPDRDQIWWAIPSVIADPAYPYRVVMKR
jgi:hypothetical protein